jgi:PspA-Associated protein
MIVRIMAEGQWDVPDGQLERLNGLDSSLEAAVDSGDEDAFRASLTTLLSAVRDEGSRLADDELVDSDLILPPEDATIEDVKGLLGDEGLIPG